MEARSTWRGVLVACLVLLAVDVSLAASSRTTNFVVTAATPELASTIASEAERFRRELAIEWLGHELPQWQRPCPITAQVSPNLGAGGATSFMFDRGRPFGWKMTMQGSRERVLDSVLPHEVTHTIFATHFGRPLPRWADEGACTTVEHESEKNKQKHNLVRFLQTRRGIAFNKMFAMKEYPPDVLPLYAQGYSVTRYLIAQRGKKHFVNYVGEGMQTNDWNATTMKYYGYRDLSDLQVKWLGWVAQGSPPLSPVGGAPDTMLASNSQLPTISPRPQSSANLLPQPSGITARGQSPNYDTPESTDMAMAAQEAYPSVKPSTSLAPRTKWQPRNRGRRTRDDLAARNASPSAMTASSDQQTQVEPQTVIQWSRNAPMNSQAAPPVAIVPDGESVLAPSNPGRSFYDRLGGTGQTLRRIENDVVIPFRRTN